MDIEFDAAKNAKNIEQRGIGFDRFADMDGTLSMEDTRRDYGERRVRVFGQIDGSLHAAVITLRGDRVRVVSLRRANEREERQYEKAGQSS